MKGKLTHDSADGFLLTWTKRDGTQRSAIPARIQITRTLVELAESGSFPPDGIPVEFDLSSGKPVTISSAGESFQRPAVAPGPAQTTSGDHGAESEPAAPLDLKAHDGELVLTRDTQRPFEIRLASGETLQVSAKVIGCSVWDAFGADGNQEFRVRVEYGVSATGAPTRVTVRGESFEEADAAYRKAAYKQRDRSLEAASIQAHDDEARAASARRAAQTEEAFSRRDPGDFRNPYNFIPALPRDPESTHGLGDAPPLHHGRYHADAVSGRITVTMVAATPVLIPDALTATFDEHEHRTFATRVRADGSPHMPVTSVRGMLRSAYEAVTNSRMAVFDGNERLSYREGASRRMFDKSPLDLLPSGLRPAGELLELSPADRMFGWVRSTKRAGKPAHRAQVRIGAVTCPVGAEGVAKVGGPAGVPLAVLSSPNPSQERFYAASDDRGTPLWDGADRGSGFAAGGGLRGRKVYPHQAHLAEAHWDTDDDHAAEWRRHKDVRDGQNASCTSWIPAGTPFRFTIDIVNASRVEAGALLWILTLGDGHHLKLGSGRPLGFGSVRLAIDDCDLRDGGTIRNRYEALADSCSGDGLALADLVRDYQQALEATYGKPFDEVAFIKGFRAAATGQQEPKLPTHYPRTTEAPDPDHPSYEWFVANEGTRGLTKQQLAPIDLDPGLKRRA